MQRKIFIETSPLNYAVAKPKALGLQEARQVDIQGLRAQCRQMIGSTNKAEIFGFGSKEDKQSGAEILKQIDKKNAKKKVTDSGAKAAAAPDAPNVLAQVT